MAKTTTIKVFAARAKRRECPSDDEGARWSRNVVAATNKTEAAERFLSGIGKVSVRDISEKVTAMESALAVSAPGTVWWRPEEAKGNRYVKSGQAWASLVWVEGSGFNSRGEELKTHGVRVRTFPAQVEKERGHAIKVELGVAAKHAKGVKGSSVSARSVAENFAVEMIDEQVVRLLKARSSLVRTMKPSEQAVLLARLLGQALSADAADEESEDEDG